MSEAQYTSEGEFDRQVRVLIEKAYPDLMGLSPRAFAALVTPLREVAVERTASLGPPTPERVPFVLVPTGVPAGDAMARTSLRGRPGFADFEPDDIARFVPTRPGPDARAYLLVDVERGEKTRNVPPDDALAAIIAQGRTGLTVAEGIALITVHPESLEKNHCFSLLDSRCGDRRVPALWISKGAPKLGWCWAGNPHTWLGSATAADRCS